MIVFPLVAAGVSAIFAATLLVRYTSKHRLPELFWGIALTMFAIASAIVALGITRGWGSFSYRLFWLLGVMLNVPWLALGSVALLRNRYITAAAAAIVVVASLFGIIVTFTTHTCHVVDRSSESQCLETVTGVPGQPVFAEQIPRGKSVWATPSPENPRSVFDLGLVYSIIGYVVVILIAIFTSRARKGVAPPRERVRGNLLIAVGVSIVAGGGTALSHFGRGAPFSVSLAVGVAAMFAGFLLTSRPPRHIVTDPGSSPT